MFEKKRVMNDRDEFDKIMKEIKEKLDNNPELKAEIQNSVANIERILGYEVDVSVIYDKSIDDYEDEVAGYDFDFDNWAEEDMSLGEFIEFIQEEDKDRKVMFDPIYLQKGLNKINNVLVTTIDNTVIIVPKTKDNEK